MNELEVDFGTGLNIVTGETGAGKSILIGALKLVLGSRAKAESVRSGSKQASVEAAFELSDTDKIGTIEKALSLELEAIENEGAEMIVRRTLSSSGRSKAYVQGSLATTAQLAEVSGLLADISSQHEHHRLIDSRWHLAYLDEFAQVQDDLRACEAAYQRLASTAKALHELEEQEDGRSDHFDLIRFQLQEIEAADPSPGELRELEVEARRLQHADRLLRVTSGAEATLYADDDAVCSRVARLTSELEELALLDNSLAPCLETLESIRVQTEEVARELGGYARSVSIDPERQSEVEERIRVLLRLQRKYGGNIESVLSKAEELRQELSRFENRDEEVEKCRTAYQAALREAESIAQTLRRKRKASATKLGQAISTELSTLGMGEAEIVIDVEPSSGGLETKAAAKPKNSTSTAGLEVLGARFSSTGVDRAEFRIATNKGETPRPLKDIASGGELSRAMLATKRVLAGLGPVGLYVFDEVDTGVGGAVAEIIGRKLKDISEHHQVICITHLPQIAAFADTHYLVKKQAVDDRTESTIEALSESERTEEIARMLGGVQITETTREAARELVEDAQKKEAPRSKTATGEKKKHPASRAKKVSRVGRRATANG